MKLVVYNAEDSGPTFKCDQCVYPNVTERGLSQHARMRHRRSQVDGHIDSGEEDSEEDLEEAEVSDISHLVVLRNWVKEKHENINLLSEVLLEPSAEFLFL